MGRLTEEEVKKQTGDTSGDSTVIKTGRGVFLSNTVSPGIVDAVTPEARAESNSKKWPKTVQAVYTVRDDSAPQNPDGSVPSKSIHAIESTGHLPGKQPDLSGDHTEDKETEEPQQEEEVEDTEISAEEKAEELEQTLEERKNMTEQNEPIRAHLNLGGLTSVTKYRDIQVSETDGYMGIVIHEDDDVTLPTKGHPVEISSSVNEKKTYVYTGMEFSIPGNKILYVLVDYTAIQDQEQGEDQGNQ